MYYTRTTASIRRHGNQETKKQDPKTRKKIKLFNVGVFILLVPFSVCMSMFCMHSCIQYASVLMDELATCVRSHFSVISYGPEISGSRSCDGDGNGLHVLYIPHLFSFGLLPFKTFNIGTHARSY